MSTNPKKILILGNPGSRRAAEAQHLLKAAPELTSTDFEVQQVNLFETDHIESSPDRVFVIGGDGTVRLAVNWLHRQSWKCPIAIIPAGTGNNLCKGLGFPLDLQEALQIALHGQGQRFIDTISINADGESWGQMLQITSTGLPARITHRFDRWRKVPVLRHPVRWLGDRFYRWLAIQALLMETRRNRDAKVIIDGEELAVTGPAIFVGNEATIGGGFTPCPNALLDDGLLDVCILPRVSYLEAFSLFREVSAGRHLDQYPDLIYRQAQTVKLVQQAEPVLVDGDVLGSPEVLEFEVIPKSLHLITENPN